jgi:hypothetical protein
LVDWINLMFAFKSIICPLPEKFVPEPPPELADLSAFKIQLGTLS